MRYAAYIDDGSIVQLLDGPREDVQRTCERHGWRFVEIAPGARVSDISHYVVGGQLVAYTPDQLHARQNPPQPRCRWSNAEMRWIDLRSLDEIKADRWMAIKAARDAAEAAGFDTPFGRFDSDPASQAKIIGAAQLASIALAQGQPFSIRWTRQDNTAVELDAPAMIAVGVAMGQHIDSVHQIGRAKRAAIEAATTHDAVMAVTWSEGS